HRLCTGKLCPKGGSPSEDSGGPRRLTARRAQAAMNCWRESVCPYRSTAGRSMSRGDLQYAQAVQRRVARDRQGFQMAKPIAALACAFVSIFAAPAAAQDQAWVERSNAIALGVIEMQAQFQPEGASQSGLEKYDGLAIDLGPQIEARFIAAEEAKLAELRAAPETESDPNVRQDIEILI